jgi:hypothetical protein
MGGELPTRSYAELRRMRRDGLAPVASGPCMIYRCDCASLSGGGAVRFGYDHCHDHDYIRGVICHPRNGNMTYTDAEMTRVRLGSPDRWPVAPELVAHWARCPECVRSLPSCARLVRLWPRERWAEVVTRVVLVNVTIDPDWLSIEALLSRVNVAHVESGPGWSMTTRPDWTQYQALRQAFGSPIASGLRTQTGRARGDRKTG